MHKKCRVYIAYIKCSQFKQYGAMCYETIGCILKQFWRKEPIMNSREMGMGLSSSYVYPRMKVILVAKLT